VFVFSIYIPFICVAHTGSQNSKDNMTSILITLPGAPQCSEEAQKEVSQSLPL